MNNFHANDHRIGAALEFAATSHAGQYRKSGGREPRLPYIVHPIDVAHTIWRWGVTDADVCVAALLHDVVEDCGVAFGEIEQRFGSQVAGWVAELTFDGSGPVSKEAYLRSFDGATVEALLIKVADRLCNTLDSRAYDAEHARSYFRKAEQLFQSFDRRHAELTLRFDEEAVRRASAEVARLTAWVETG